MPNRRIGIAGACVLSPKWRLGNDWFLKNVPGFSTKFSTRSGIDERGIFEETECECARQVVDALFHKFPKLRREDCAGGVLATGTGIPSSIITFFTSTYEAHKARLEENNIDVMLQDFTRTTGLTDSLFTGINWGCSGFAMALQILLNDIVCQATSEGQYFLIVTVTKTSRLLDYTDYATGGLFGDLATATLLTTSSHPYYPPSHLVVSAKADVVEVEKEIFGFGLRHDVLIPGKNGHQDRDPIRPVFHMDALGMATQAPITLHQMVMDAMSGGIVSEIDRVLPNQVSHWVVDWLRIRLEESGVNVPVINGLMARTGNVSGSSIPSSIATLTQNGEALDGITVCPTFGIGWPNTPTVSAGYVVLESA